MVYMFLAEGFEEIEALCPLDIMRRAGIEALTVGVGAKQITGAHGITVDADMTAEEFERRDLSDLDMIFLPGGMPGTLNLAASNTVISAINAAAATDRYIAAICAAPSILGDMGLLRGREAICYPGFEDRLTGATVSEKRVVLDGKILTAAGMGAALDMGIKIVEIFCGEQKAAALRHAVIAD
jgi:4-methyl-5(b-hydroxyethyl)-thiazole monophosphate biosynthesis